MYNAVTGKPVKSVGNLTHEDKTGVYNTDRYQAIYAEKHGLTLLGWKLPDSRNEPDPETTYPLRNQAKLHSFRTRPYTCTDSRFPHYEQAVSIDEDNKNTKWQDSQRKNSVRLMNMRPSMTRERISTWP
jgi:hypothetical protein